MSEVIVVTSGKGGVGKTTTTAPILFSISADNDSIPTLTCVQPASYNSLHNS